MLPLEQLDNLMVKTGIWARAHVATLTARHTPNFQYSKNDLIRSRQLQIVKTLQNPIHCRTTKDVGVLAAPRAASTLVLSFLSASVEA